MGQSEYISAIKLSLEKSARHEYESFEEISLFTYC